MFEKMIEISLLYDFYGQLLTPKQQTILKLYYEDNYTLAEIAEELGITRQAVHDSIKKTDKILHDYEEKLGLTHKFEETSAAIKKIDGFIEKALMAPATDDRLITELRQIKAIIDQLND